jgi:hypothetical protein
MSHHGNNEDRAAMSELTKKLMGEYPNGRLNENDAGALAVSIGQEGGAVVMRFPKPVAWIGFTPEQSVEIAQMLIKRAREAGFTKPVTLSF